MLPGLVMASDIKKGRYTKEKKIHKAYIVDANAALEIVNKFGNVYVTTWDENKTDIEIVITVSGNNEEKVNKRLESIDVVLEAFKTRISAVTKIGGGSFNNVSMEINYTVRIPKKGSLNLNNQYGGITTGIINGKAQIHCEYGRINLDQLNNSENTIKMQYSDGGNINFVNKADIHAEYSGLTVKKANSVSLKSAYTNSNFATISDLIFNGEYGDLKASDLGKLTGRGDYLNINIGTLRGDFNFSSDYSNITLGNVVNGARNITIDSAYTNVNISTAPDYYYDFEFSLEYGGLSGGNGLTFTEKKEKDYSSYYKGFYKKSGGNKISVKSEYAGIQLKRN